jgi:hypothetical protein
VYFFLFVIPANEPGSVVYERGKRKAYNAFIEVKGVGGGVRSHENRSRIRVRDDFYGLTK